MSSADGKVTEFLNVSEAVWHTFTFYYEKMKGAVAFQDLSREDMTRAAGQLTGAHYTKSLQMQLADWDEDEVESDQATDNSQWT